MANALPNPSRHESMLEMGRRSAADGQKDTGFDRAALKLELFRSCDTDGDGTLTVTEMRQLAELSGFQGSVEEWETEYRDLCMEHGLSFRSGIPERIVMKMLDDESEKGIYFTDAELACLVDTQCGRSVAQPPHSTKGRLEGGQEKHGSPRTQRESLKRELFRKCDRDSDGHLKSQEMYELARLVGFEGSGEDWALEYPKLCAELGISAAEGVPEGHVLQLLDDDSPKGAFCSDRELAQMLQLPEGYTGAMQKAGGPDGCPEDAKLDSKVDADAEADADADTHAYTATSVLFAGANPSTEESTLREQFEALGVVSNFYLARSPAGLSQGVGQVDYSLPREADAAVRCLSGIELDGRELMVKLKRPGPRKRGKGGKASKGGRGQDGGKGGPGKGGKRSAALSILPGIHRREGKSLWFKGLSPDTPATYLQQLFAEQGRLQHFQIFDQTQAQGGAPPRTLRGVVTYTSAEDARRALQTLAGTCVDGHDLFLEPDRFRDYAQDQDASSASAAQATLVHDTRVQEETSKTTPPALQGSMANPTPTPRLPLPLQDAPSGTMTRCAGPGGGKRRRLGEDGPGSGTQPSPRTSVASGQLPVPPPPPPPSTQEAATAASSAATECDGEITDPNRTLLFMNLPPEVLGNRLRCVFRSLGSVRSITLCTAPDGTSRGCGFVEFEAPDVARRAQQRLHQAGIGGRRIRVFAYGDTNRRSAGRLESFWRRVKSQTGVWGKRSPTATKSSYWQTRASHRRT